MWITSINYVYTFLNSTELRKLEEKNKRLSDTFLGASYWSLNLSREFKNADRTSFTTNLHEVIICKYTVLQMADVIWCICF